LILNRRLYKLSQSHPYMGSVDWNLENRLCQVGFLVSHPYMGSVDWNRNPCGWNVCRCRRTPIWDVDWNY